MSYETVVVFPAGGEMTLDQSGGELTWRESER